MKRSVKLLLYLIISFLYFSCSNPEEIVEKGSIYGVVTDKVTGEPLKSAGVELLPGGLKTVTGSEGQFEFKDVEAGNYNLNITKTGYSEQKSNTIIVKNGQRSKCDIQLELLPPALKVVDDNSVPIDVIDFGSEEGDMLRSINIFNDGSETLEWEITKTTAWIDSISKERGSLKANQIQPIVVAIDRNKLAEGSNVTTLSISSSNGSKLVTVKATNNREAISINVLECTKVTASTAVFNAEMLNAGNPKYTERGFVYATVSMPTVENTVAKLTAIVSDSLAYNVLAKGLNLDETYYVRAYAINSLGVSYSSNEVSFITNATLPQVSTQAVSNINIAEGIANFNGTVVSAGDPVYTERGFAYGLVPNPTIDDNKKIVSSSGTGTYSANITGLAEGKTYYVRAYATNSKGTGYGSEVTFNTDARMPVVTTQAITNINMGAGTATFTGKVTDLGDLGYTERGFVYSITHNPTTDDKKEVVTGTGTGVYSKNVTGIEEGYTYYMRSYVTNSKGTVYSEEISFEFTARMPEISIDTVSNINIKAGAVTFNGKVLSLGDLGYAEKGFVYSTSHNPTIDDKKEVVTGTGAGVYSKNVTGIEEGYTYYVRAYVTNSKGTVYSEEISFEFMAKMPVVTTQAVTNINIGAGTATFNGEVTFVGDPEYTERGFVYSTSHNPTIDDKKEVVTGIGAGVYSKNVTDIEEGYTYYVRAYVTNSKGTVYSEEINFEFMAKMPVVTTQAVTNINIEAGTVTFNGMINQIGDPAYIEKGFVYGTLHNPIIEDDTKKVVSGRETGKFSANVTDFIMGNVYYVRAYATSIFGTSYGAEMILDFNAIMPVVETCDITNIDATKATLNGIIITIGDPCYSEKGFVYGTSSNPSILDNKIVVTGNNQGAFSQKIEGLHIQTKYYVKAYAKSGETIIYGEEKSFITESPEYYVLDLYGLMVQKQDISSGCINWDTANNACQNSSIGGFNDWRLPTVSEMLILYQNRTIIGGFQSGSQTGTDFSGIRAYTPEYWTSELNETKDRKDMYKVVNFTTGTVQSMQGTEAQIVIEEYVISWNYYYYRGYARAVRTITK